MERKKQLELKAIEDRKIASENLEKHLRVEFFRLNPDALSSDFENALPKLKEQLFLDRMKAQKTTEDLIRGSRSMKRM